MGYLTNFKIEILGELPADKISPNDFLYKISGYKFYANVKLVRSCDAFDESKLKS